MKTFDDFTNNLPDSDDVESFINAKLGERNQILLRADKLQKEIDGLIALKNIVKTKGFV